MIPVILTLPFGCHNDWFYCRRPLSTCTRVRLSGTTTCTFVLHVFFQAKPPPPWPFCVHHGRPNCPKTPPNRSPYPSTPLTTPPCPVRRPNAIVVPYYKMFNRSAPLLPLPAISSCLIRCPITPAPPRSSCHIRCSIAHPPRFAVSSCPTRCPSTSPSPPVCDIVTPCQMSNHPSSRPTPGPPTS